MAENTDHIDHWWVSGGTEAQVKQAVMLHACGTLQIEMILFKCYSAPFQEVPARFLSCPLVGIECIMLYGNTVVIKFWGPRDPIFIMILGTLP